MRQPIEVLFDTCKEILGKDRVHTLQQFQEECKQDKIMGEGVAAICEAMQRYAMPLLSELEHFKLRLIEALNTIKILQEEIAELREDSVIVE